MIVDDYEIRGGGIVREALPDRQAVGARPGAAPELQVGAQHHPARAAGREATTRRPRCILVTGEHEHDRKGVAKALEDKLFEDGKVVYFLGIGNVLYGVDADIERKPENRLEHMRRLAEVANLMLDAGMILVVAAAELHAGRPRGDQDRGPARLDRDHLGRRHDHDRSRACDLHLPGGAIPEAVDQLKAHLQDKGVIFRPW